MYRHCGTRPAPASRYTPRRCAASSPSASKLALAQGLVLPLGLPRRHAGGRAPAVPGGARARGLGLGGHLARRVPGHLRSSGGSWCGRSARPRAPRRWRGGRRARAARAAALALPLPRRAGAPARGLVAVAIAGGPHGSPAGCTSATSALATWAWASTSLLGAHGRLRACAEAADRPVRWSVPTRREPAATLRGPRSLIAMGLRLASSACCWSPPPATSVTARWSSRTCGPRPGAPWMRSRRRARRPGLRPSWRGCARAHDRRAGRGVSPRGELLGSPGRGQPAGRRAVAARRPGLPGRRAGGSSPGRSARPAWRPCSSGRTPPRGLRAARAGPPRASSWWRP